MNILPPDMVRISLLSFCVCIAGVNRGADILVGPQLEIADLQTAVSVANDGDRILVSAGVYLGNVSIDKSLTFLPLVEGTRYTVQGRVYCGGASGKRIDLSGIRVLTGVDLQATLTARTDLVIRDSYISTFQNSDQSLLRLELYRDTIAQGGWLVGSCTMFGCRILVATGQLPQAIYLGSSALPDENWFIGNVFQLLMGTRAFSIVNPNRPFHIENNLAFGDALFMHLSGGGLNAPMPQCSIVNNTFIDTGSDGVSTLIDNGGGAGSDPVFYAVNVRNNARIGTGTVAPLSSVTAEFMSAAYNGVALPSTVNLSTGEPLAGSPLINSGDPDPRFLDLDLTTNDMGCYGGSNSRANFTTPMGSAVVGYMRAPRLVAQGSTVNINAVGFDR